MQYIFIFLLSIMASSALAGEFHVLEFKDAVLRSKQGQDTIHLKRELRGQLGIKAREAKILSVMMVAKTAAGKGQATLVVGQDRTHPQIIAGNQNKWNRKGEKSFDRALFKAPGRSSEGRWQIHLKGNFKIRQIVVEIAKKKPKQVTLNLNHSVMRSRQGDDTLYLRTLAQQQHGIDTEKYEIVSAKLVAKSAAGKGQGHLLVGQKASNPKNIAGTRDKFQSNAHYSPVVFENPKANSNGVWQIKVQGRIKVNKVVLTLKKKNK
ncbi:MAG: hypothetical protein HRT45_00365 [Bdellovibrionales bacterium]|nr:hypothetical protein [Bdellovibrionales bacterium]